ncbi:hypothetical protein AOLI_G00135420 [Acnodon oligacanthus]
MRPALSSVWHGEADSGKKQGLMGAGMRSRLSVACARWLRLGDGARPGPFRVRPRSKEASQQMNSHPTCPCCPSKAPPKLSTLSSLPQPSSMLGNDDKVNSVVAKRVLALNRLLIRAAERRPSEGQPRACRPFTLGLAPHFPLTAL